MESKGKASSAMETENFAMVSPFSNLLNSSGGTGATSAMNVFPFSSSFDMSVDFSDSGKSSLGFMDLLGAHQDLGPNSLFDFPMEYVEGRGLQLDHQLQYSTHAAPETPDTTAGNPPATPNTSSISSSSNEALADEQQPKRAADDDDQDDTTKKVSKPKKKKQKREREPRFAFMTKSEVDHLEDGYRWRKYGQKAVKNSPFPRSYYRCTTAMCGVKKRVERSCEDPTIVVTTYEGQHTHPSPAGPRGATTVLPVDHSHPMGFASTGSATAAAGAFSLPSTSQQQSLLPSLPHHSYFLNLPPSMTFSNSTPPGFCSTSTASLFRDHGLLQDMVNPDAKRE